MGRASSLAAGSWMRSYIASILSATSAFGYLPVRANPSIRSMLVSRKLRLSAACTRFASGDPPHSCTRISASTPSARSSCAPFARSHCADDFRAPIRMGFLIRTIVQLDGDGVWPSERALHVMRERCQTDGIRRVGREAIEPVERFQKMRAVVRIVFRYPESSERDERRLRSSITHVRPAW